MAQIGGTESPSWAELLGSNHWSGLLDPLDDTLRDLLLMWGDMCQVTADSFISDDNSQYHGCCRYSKNSLLDQTFFPNAADYAVVEYLDALSTFLIVLKESNWMGYVAVSSDAHAEAVGHRNIYIVWRSTSRIMEILEDITIPLVPFDDDNEDVKVMLGWRDIYNSSDPNFEFNKKSAREQLLEKVKKLVGRYKDERLSIVCVGHSLGGALVILSAYDIVKQGLSKIGEEYFPVCAMTFESPRVGNQAFRDSWDQQPNLRLLRVKNKGDPVPDYPDLGLGYVDFGTVLEVASEQSRFLKVLTVDSGKSPCLEAKHDRHNLQVVLHTVAGWTGENGDFDCTIVKRSLALVNKHGGYLSTEFKIPASWWVEKNKGMVLDKDGDWVVAPPGI
ncbi:phosphatidylcholine 1-acylhydrolase [Musa troglodytarum]|uniref:Phospholipase A1 n=1 Tax=Musa troglodytarum TaxID=320322 RepID=A0A9E7F4D3_9LILI|nr:phosphatidylcholine 1-acylhydrolase [Musa troglodytarum]